MPKKQLPESLKQIAVSFVEFIEEVDNQKALKKQKSDNSKDSLKNQ